MRICYVSTYGITCGIASYTAMLARAVVDLGHEVLVAAELTHPNAPTTPAPKNPPFIRCWSRTTPDAADFARAASAFKPDVIHVQHEHGLFPVGEHLDAVLRAAPPQTRKFATLHTVAPNRSEIDLISALLANRVTAVAHTWPGYCRLRAQNATLPVVRLPHGTLAPLKQLDRRRARAELVQRSSAAIPQDGAFVGLSFGFVSPGKAVEETVDVFCDLVGARLLPPDATWYVVGGHTPAGAAIVMPHVVEAQRRTPNAVCVVARYPPDDEAALWLNACDLWVLNGHNDSPYSASGQAHLALGYGIATASRRNPIYADLDDSVSLKFSSGLQLADAIAAAANSPALLDELRAAARRRGRETAWPAVARRHIALYESRLETE